MLRIAFLSVVALGLAGDFGPTARARLDGKRGQFPPLPQTSPALPPNIRDAVEGQYRGALFIVNEDLAADVKTQRLICDHLAAFDLRPRNRVLRFAWCESPPLMVVTGWSGSIQKLAESRDGWLVTMRVSPLVYHAVRGHGYSPDAIDEVYLVGRTGEIVYQGSKPVGDLPPGSLLFP